MNPGYLPYPKGFSTRAIHAGQGPENWDSMSVVPPIVMSTTFKQDAPSVFKEYEYGRHGNPSKDILEKSLASLEHAKYAALCVSCGMAAASTLLNMLQPGDHIIAGEVIYGGVYRLCKEHMSKFGIQVSFVDTTNVSNLEAAMLPNTKLIWIETPTNPCLNVTDLRAVSKVAKSRNVILAVDNTFLTPYLQRPLDLGADVSVYSVTTYLNGHTDVTMGVIVTNREDVYKHIRALQITLGNIPAPFDCALVNRGLKTLTVRMRQHATNALAVATYLESHRNIFKVLHPGLPSHPQYELTKSQTSGHSGMLAIYINGGKEETKKFVCALKIFTLAVSLGGIDSLVAVPETMTHSQMSAEERTSLGITPNLVRLDVGLEDVDDLIKDLEQALNY